MRLARVQEIITDKELQEKLTINGDKQLKNYLDNEKRLEKLEKIFENIFKQN